MILAMRRIAGYAPSNEHRSPPTAFSLSLPFRRNKSIPEEARKQMSLSQVVLHVMRSFRDVESSEAERLRCRIRTAREVKDLWMLRSEVHQLISLYHTQQEAAQRINALLPCFAGWVTKHSLVKI